MTTDITYENYQFRIPELPHHYGDKVHLSADPLLLSQLAELCQPSTRQPRFTHLVRELYQGLLREVIAREVPRVTKTVETRMAESCPQGVWHGQILDPDTRFVSVDIARAGTLPSQIAFELLTDICEPDNIRQDHLYMNRVTNERGEVTGVNVSGSKLGGEVDNALVLLPDPMGATGGSLSHAVSIYKGLAEGSPKKLIAMHLIVTPEYLKRLQTDHPDVEIYAVRLDRGLSSPEVLRSELGKYWDEEKGLNEVQYIVPGAGGVGELLNNCFV